MNNEEAWERLTTALSSIGFGIAWMGFFIGLGLYNFQGCSTHVVKSATEHDKAGIHDSSTTR